MSDSITIPDVLRLTAHIHDSTSMRAVEEACKEAYLMGYADGREATMKERETV